MQPVHGRLVGVAELAQLEHVRESCPVCALTTRKGCHPAPFTLRGAMLRFLATPPVRVLRAFGVGGAVCRAAGVAGVVGVTAVLGIGGVVGEARAAVSLGGGPGGLQALAVSGGAAYAIVDSGDASAPLALVRSAGGSAGAPRKFGVRRAEFPDLAAGPGDSLVVAWGQRASNGDGYVVAGAPTAPGAPFGAAQPLASGTGPGQLALDSDGAPVLAFPDILGNAALLRDGRQEGMTATAPEERHLPLDVAVDTDGRAFVLDLVQTRRRSELRLLGPQAPAAPVVSVGALRDMRATLAIEGGRAYVAFALDGRATLAIAALNPSASWWNRRLPGRGGASGAPAVLRSGNSTYVAYTQRQLHDRGDVFLASEGPNPLRIRRLTRTHADEREPFAAAGAGGALYVGWSRGKALRGPAKAMLQRLR
jgi:hypothetical protein